MKLSLFFTLILSLNVAAKGVSQNITVKADKKSIEAVIQQIQKQSGYNFFYDKNELKNIVVNHYSVKNATLTNALAQLFNNKGIDYKIINKTVVIKYQNGILVTSSHQSEIQTNISKHTDPIKIIRGVVKTPEGTPIEDANVIYEGKKRKATRTNAKGEFRMEIPDDEGSVIFSYVGYAKRVVPVAGKSVINIVLEPEDGQLEEISVAYGVIKNEHATNSVAQIKGEDFEDRNITNTLSVLSGAVAGVQTTSGGGQPGDGPSIRIRGFGSINASNDPLYIVDGAPYDNPFSNLNSRDIATISILKDASAAALYGARAANGVVLITTKKGKLNSSSSNFSATYGTSSKAVRDYDRVNTWQYYPLMWEAYRNGLVTNGSTTEAANAQASRNIKNRLGYNPFNVPDSAIVLNDGTLNPSAQLLYPEDVGYDAWKKALSRNRQRSQLNFSTQGGSSKTIYFMSISYVKEHGYSLKSDFERATGRINLSTQATKWFRTGLNVFGSTVSSNQANTSSGINENPFYVALRMAPIYPVYEHDSLGNYILDANGNKIWDDGSSRPYFTGRNILAETMLNENKINRKALTSNLFGEITFLKKFKFTTNYSAFFNNYLYSVYDNKEIGDAVGSGRATRTNTSTNTYNFNQLLNYNTYAGIHNIGVLLGHENYRYDYNYLSTSKSNQIVDGSTELSNFVDITSSTGYADKYRTEGYFSRLDYSYANTYLLSGSFRRDASSRFSPSNRWGNFWSASFGWIITKGNLIKAEWLNFLKFRASYGQVGSDDMNSYYLYQSYYDVGNNNGNEAGLLQSTLSGQDLKWEASKSFDAGIDFSILKNRITGTFEVFDRRSSNLLFDVPVVMSSGYETQPQNIGSMYNKGIEITINAIAVKTKNFNWQIAANWTTIKNRITKLPQSEIINSTKKLMIGHSIYDYWLRDWYGVDPDNGNTLYRADAYDPSDATTQINAKGDTVTSTANNARYHYAGTAIPKYSGSIRNTFTYKSFSLNILATYQIGGKIYNGEYQTLMQSGTTSGLTLHADELKRWQKPGDITDVPRLDYTQGTNFNASNSDRWLVSASYLNFKSAILGYRLPKKLMKKLSLKGLRFYISGENLYILTAMKGMDPTKTFTGVISTTSTYYPSRTITIGMNLSL